MPGTVLNVIDVLSQSLQHSFEGHGIIPEIHFKTPEFSEFSLLRVEAGRESSVLDQDLSAIKAALLIRMMVWNFGKI